MKYNMIRYVKEYGEDSFLKRPLNHVDSLVLSQFSYIEFQDIVPGIYDQADSITLQNIQEENKLFADNVLAENNRLLFEYMAESKRFGSIKLNYYVNIVEADWETQFSAITFFLDDGTAYIAFRGTDKTLVGWKEDFNMSFMDLVPGQAYSVKYLDEVATQFSHSLYIGGHSKGGNLAIYGSINCLEEVKERIRAIYSMDGPGIRKELLDTEGFKGIKGKIIKIIPHSSLVGLFFEESINYMVIKSDAIGIFQHNPYSWMIKKGMFLKVKRVFKVSMQINSILTHWLYSLEVEKRKEFVDAIYKLLQATQEEDVVNLIVHWKKNIFSIRRVLATMDEESETMLKEMFRSLFCLLRVKAKQSIVKVPFQQHNVQDATERLK